MAGHTSTFVKRLLLQLIPVLLLLGAPLSAAEYHVGPGQTPGDPKLVPWKELNPGDTVYFHYQPEPYRTKFVIARRGEPDRPIRVIGVPDPATGALPRIDGNGASTVPGLEYTGQERCVVKIGNAGFEGAGLPAYVELENLEIFGARDGNPFTDHKGKACKYRVNAAALHIEAGHFITIRGCKLHDSSQGLSTSYQSHDVLVERCHIFGNGNFNSITEHNIYSESLRITFLYNRLGPLSTVSRGNNIKDRSAGLVVGWNWIEGGNRCLDLVDTTHPELFNTPEYASTRVFGNIIIKQEGKEQVGEDPELVDKEMTHMGIIDRRLDTTFIPGENNQVIHYGGDSEAETMYRNGVLWFDSNSIISYRSGATVAFRCSTPKQMIVASNNVWSVGEAFHNRLYFLNEEGILFLAGRNYAPANSRDFAGELNPTIHVIGRKYLITGIHPRYMSDTEQDYRLQGRSIAVGKAGPALPALVEWPVRSRIYKRHQGYEDLPALNPALGALPPGPSK